MATGQRHDRLACQNTVRHVMGMGPGLYGEEQRPERDRLVPRLERVFYAHETLRI